MSDFLPYQVSFILCEELGFNETCYAVYSQHDQTRVYDNDSIREGKIIPAILYQQALRFFRDKYGLFVSPSVISYEDGPYLWFFEINCTTLPFGTDLGETDDFETYEEAISTDDLISEIQNYLSASHPTLPSDAMQFAELHQYQLAEHDEGGYIGINEKRFAELLEEYASAKIAEMEMEIEELKNFIRLKCITPPTK